MRRVGASCPLFVYEKGVDMEDKDIMIELPEETEKELSNGKGDEE